MESHALADLLGWIGTALCLAGTFLIARGRRGGFVVRVCGDCLWLVAAVMASLPSLVAAEVAFVAIDVYGATRGRKRE